MVKKINYVKLRDDFFKPPIAKNPRIINTGNHEALIRLLSLGSILPFE